jgi:hypothetical protein
MIAARREGDAGSDAASRTPSDASLCRCRVCGCTERTSCAAHSGGFQWHWVSTGAEPLCSGCSDFDETGGDHG